MKQIALGLTMLCLLAAAPTKAQVPVEIRQSQGKTVLRADAHGFASFLVRYPKGVPPPKEIADVQSDAGVAGIRHMDQHGFLLEVSQAPAHRWVHVTYQGFWW